MYPGLAWLGETEAGRGWLAALPRLVDECAEMWRLSLGPPFPGSFVSLVLPAQQADGTPAVLKLQFPDRESEHEAAALHHWNGEGAVRLLAHDAQRHALLLERCVPGSPLSDVEPAAALDVLVALLPRLWRPAAAPFRPLAEEAAWWAETIQGQAGLRSRLGSRLVDVALEALQGLPGTQGEQVLIHQDLHAGNVLRAERESWLAIDPKPLIGERAFGLAPIVRSFELGHSRRLVEYRLDRLTAELGCDRDRVRLWTIAQTVAWSVDGGHFSQHLETARWLLEATSI